MKKIWNMKVAVISVEIGALGTIPKRLIKVLKDLEIRGRVETIQTTALLRLAWIQKRVLEIWTEKDIDTRLTKAWIAIDWLSDIWKSDLTDRMKCSFFQAAVVSILLYGCTTWTLTKRMEKKLDGNYTRMVRSILNKSWRQHPTKHQLYGHLPPITKTLQVRRTRNAGRCWIAGMSS